MSKLFDLADYIRETVEKGVSELDGINVITQRQKEIAYEVQKVASRATGSVVLIEPGSGRNPNPEAGRLPRIDTDYSVSIWQHPIVAPEQGYDPIDDVLEAVILCLHGRQIQGNHRREIVFREWALVPHQTYLIYNAIFTTRVTLTNRKN